MSDRVKAIKTAKWLLESSLTDKTTMEQKNLAKAFLAECEHVDKLSAELEQERVRLAGCGAAALGYQKYDELKAGDFGHSAFLDDVLKLRKMWDDECAKSAQLLEALEFYASENNYDEVYHDEVDGQEGDIAHLMSLEDVEYKEDSFGELVYACAGKIARAAIAKVKGEK